MSLPVPVATLLTLVTLAAGSASAAGVHWERHFRDALVLCTEARLGAAPLAEARAVWLGFAAYHEVPAPGATLSAENHEALTASAAGVCEVTEWPPGNQIDPWDYLRHYLTRLEAGAVEWGPDPYGSWSYGALLGARRFVTEDDLAGRVGRLLGAHVAIWHMGAVAFKPKVVIMETGPEGAVEVVSSAVPGELAAPASVRVGNRGVFSASAGWAAQMVAEMLYQLALNLPGRGVTDRALTYDDGAWPVAYAMLLQGLAPTRDNYERATLPPEAFGLTTEQRQALAAEPWSAEVAIELSEGLGPVSAVTSLRRSARKVVVLLGEDRASVKPAIMLGRSYPASRRLRYISPVEYANGGHVPSETILDGLVVRFVRADDGTALRSVTLPAGYSRATVYRWSDRRGIRREEPTP